MCKSSTKIDNISTAAMAAKTKGGGGVASSAVPPPPKSPGANSAKSLAKSGSNGVGNGGGTGRASPAFNGAKFDKSGFCLKHPSVQLVNPMKDDGGKLVYQELKVSCPNCQAAKHKSKKNTSLGGGKVRQGHRVHGAPSSQRSRSKSRERVVPEGPGGGAGGGGGGGGRGRDRSRSLTRSSSHRSASKSRERNGGGGGGGGGRQRREYDTPFDSKGRCHHHRNVQLAAKKITGGWKVLHSVCPKCMEDKFERDGNGNGGSAGHNGDDRSVRSGRSGAGGANGVGGNANGQFDKNGCCVLHTHVQVAKKRVFGTGFKVVRACPACEGHDVGPDDISVSSKRSASSRRSARSAKSAASRGRPGTATKSGRYGALPFDGDGYCCRHPNVQLAKKKALGGFKIVHDVCPECAREDGGGGGRNRSRSRSKSRGTGRVFDDSGSETSSFRSGRSSSRSYRSSNGGHRRKKIRVKNLRTEDDEGKRGRYTGDVDDEHRPHGNGTIRYEDGTTWEGVWKDGSKVHGKDKKAAGGGKGRSKY